MDNSLTLDKYTFLARGFTLFCFSVSLILHCYNMFQLKGPVFPSSQAGC